MHQVGAYTTIHATQLSTSLLSTDSSRLYLQTRCKSIQLALRVGDPGITPQPLSDDSGGRAGEAGRDAERTPTPLPPNSDRHLPLLFCCGASAASARGIINVACARTEAPGAGDIACTCRPEAAKPPAGDLPSSSEPSVRCCCAAQVRRGLAGGTHAATAAAAPVAVAPPPASGPQRTGATVAAGTGLAVHERGVMQPGPRLRVAAAAAATAAADPLDAAVRGPTAAAAAAAVLASAPFRPSDAVASDPVTAFPAALPHSAVLPAVMVSAAVAAAPLSEALASTPGLIIVCCVAAAAAAAAAGFATLSARARSSCFRAAMSAWRRASSCCCTASLFCCSGDGGAEDGACCCCCCFLDAAVDDGIDHCLRCRAGQLASAGVSSARITVFCPSPPPRLHLLMADVGGMCCAAELLPPSCFG